MTTTIKAFTMQPMAPGIYTLYRDNSGESTQTQDSAFAPAWAATATATAPAKPRHAYVAFQSLPCIPEHLRHSAEWLAEQEILRKISRCILTPGTNESDIIHALKSVEVNYGLVNMSTRMAQPMVVLGAPGAFGGESEMRVTDILAPVRAIPAKSAAERFPMQSLEILSPLHAAVIANKAQVAHHLLTGPNGAGSGADVNQRSEWNGRTAVMIAAANGNYDMVDLLLDYDANLLQVDAAGNTALVYAVSAAKVPSAAIVERLLAECPELADARALPYAAYAAPATFWGDAMRAARKAITRDGGEAALFIVWREMERIEDVLFAACAQRSKQRRSAAIFIGSLGALSGRDPRLGAGANFPGLL